MLTLIYVHASANMYVICNLYLVFYLLTNAVMIVYICMCIIEYHPIVLCVTVLYIVVNAHFQLNGDIIYIFLIQRNDTEMHKRKIADVF